jgi:hypothetical protein
VVVGDLINSSTSTFRAFVYDGSAIYNLQDLVEPTSLTGWVLTEANDINDRGQIVGNGYLNGQPRAYLLTPIPEPSSTCLLATWLVVGPLFTGWRRGDQGQIDAKSSAIFPRNCPAISRIA